MFSPNKQNKKMPIQTENENPLTILNSPERKKEKFFVEATSEKSWYGSMSKRQKLFSLGLIALVSLGALGAGTNGFKKGNALFKFAETVVLKKPETVVPSSNSQTVTPQLSKEYVYAGGRMLAIEEQ